MRSTLVQIWPAFAERADRRLLGRPLGSTPGVDDHRVLAAQLEQRLAEAVDAGLHHLAARLHRARVDDEVDARVRGERAAGAGVAVHELQHVAEVEQLDEARARRAASSPTACRRRRCPSRARRRSARRRSRSGRSTARAARRRRAARGPSGRRRPSRPAGCGRGAAGRARRTARSRRCRPRRRRASRRAACRPRGSASSASSSALGAQAPRGGLQRGARARPGAVRAQAGCAARAARTAASTASGEPAGMRPTSSPVAGSQDVEARRGAWIRGQVQHCASSACPYPTARCAQRHGFRQAESYPGDKRAMTSERTQAYGRVVRTLQDVGPTKLHAAEQERVRDAADTLIFAATYEEARETLARRRGARRAARRVRAAGARSARPSSRRTSWPAGRSRPSG